MCEKSEIQVEISDYILTPLSCSSLLNELIKCLIYQKCQIPYPYNWLKCTINRRRKREKEESDGDLKTRPSMNFTVENHFRLASQLYDDLEEAMGELAIVLSKSIVSEVIILFGPTPFCPKEVCSIKLPMLAEGHLEEQHVKEALKHQHKVLQQVFLSTTWLDSIDSSIPCTNIYIFIKKNDNEESHFNHFKQCSPLNFQDNVKQYKILLNWAPSENQVCCKHLQIFNEKTETEVKRTKIKFPVLDNNKCEWFQFGQSIKGFKNCFVNKTATCDLW